MDSVLSHSPALLADAQFGGKIKKFTTVLDKKTISSATMKPEDSDVPYSCKLSDIVWRNVILLFLVNAGSVYGLVMYLTGEAPLILFPLVILLASFGGMGITAGVHRLWSHRAYKATWQLRLILMIANTMAFQNSIFEWARDHRVHHRYTDTNADPHNAARGFFFSHMGWLMVRKHELVKSSGKDLDLSDLEQDEIVMFQKRNYSWLMPLVCFILPTLALQYSMGLSLRVAFYSGTLLRWNIGLHATWLVNSAAHGCGMRPYDKNISARQNKFVAIVAFGEGWHNFHHVFPWDYKTDELGDYTWNHTRAFIDFFAKIGWAYEMKEVSEEIIRKRAKRTGDGTTAYGKYNTKHRRSGYETHLHAHRHDENPIWGWGDIAMNEDDKACAIILKKKRVDFDDTDGFWSGKNVGFTASDNKED